ncbi:MAG: chromate transporter [Acidocella sp.]|nr:chromate transporter [Acidocella sp.]
MTNAPPAPSPEPPRLSHAQLFTGFLSAGVIGFGGVLPVARRMIVDEKRWMSQVAFNDLFSLCQFMPGANIVNLAFAIGARHQGVSGAAAAVLGLLAAPMAIVMLLGAAYARFGTLPLAQHALAGLAAAAAGLVLGTALRIAGPIFANRRNIPLSLAVFALVVFVHLSLPVTMLIVVPVSLFLARRAA